MWFEDTQKQRRWDDGLRHLRRDPVMRKIIKKVGPCTLTPRRDYFIVLCKSIFTQQISTKIATILFGRFCELFPRKKPTPKGVIDVLCHDHNAKHCGLSRQKRAYLTDLAKHFADGQIPTRRLAAMSDEEIIECLTRVKGVGRWTAEMVLIFVLNRPDVWPVDDLGLREGARVAFNLPERPGAKVLRELGERFRPHRTLATWYLWRYLGLQTQKKSSVARKAKM
jgi:DNA-3-methyladenine glycosylase II